MLINDTETWLYLDADGAVIEGGPLAPAGAASVLVAAGGNLDDATARKYGVTGRLKSPVDVDHVNPGTGEPLVLTETHAVARRLVEGTEPYPHAVRSKMVPGPRENKAGLVEDDEATVLPVAPVATSTVTVSPPAKSAGLASPPKSADDKKS